jgi:hypothetical protein
MCLVLKETNTIKNTQEVIEVLSYKIGTIILILGAMHFFNVVVFFKLRNKAQLLKGEKANVVFVQPK